MDERELRSRVSWIVGLVLATAFVGTIVWSVAQDSDDHGGGDGGEVTFDGVGEPIDPGETTLTFDPDVPEILLPARDELPEATLTVHTDGCGVIRSELAEDPQGLQWSVADVDGFDVLERDAVGETQYRYFQSGTYTVTLEAWGGDSYVPISNTVEITC